MCVSLASFVKGKVRPARYLTTKDTKSTKFKNKNSETFVSGACPEFSRRVNFVVKRKPPVEQEEVHSRLITARTNIGASRVRNQSAGEEARPWPMKHF
jgi:hypothetical protein